MQLEGVHRVYFLGIGGIGMSGLARYFLKEGRQVAGYDRTPTPLTRALEAEGAAIHYTEDIQAIPTAFRNPEGTLVVYTPAVPAAHAEYRYFLDGAFTVRKRSQVLGMISEATRCLAVAGTHGKTTTSCILAHLLREAGLEVMAFLGGVSEDFGSNFLMEGTAFSVVEADEFDRSFLWLTPEVACVTSMDADHLDIYGNAQALTEAFGAFAARVRPGGRLVVRNGLPLHGITYGIEDDAQYCIENLRTRNGQYEFDIRTPEGTFTSVGFGKPGRHNLLNGLAAFTMAVQVGAPPDRLVKALGTFKGVQRRFSYKLRSQEFTFIDDYAHHPAEIDAVYQAIREMHPGKEILAVFQPHLYSRTRDFGADFARSLSRFDRVWLLDIYPAREEPLEGITSQWLLEQIDNPRKRRVGKSELIDAIRAQMPEILLTIGAGDIGLEVEAIKQAFSHASELE
ncbi:UDP-N-acetylmuramate--L-alanine ligase [Robiginitalea sp. M366]|uniref:UDP-N-acetylmuramate--L-alanine ligase n=1 Tax=Robiginitalea aestuariiviva TaxID=3036903 RepID=UPI00240E55AF|nr:UDP-N-acetylmuramate--L-alanine ligase [Robiginitalea aestuariiviva]MDG1570857.1 UDP-N-acetylmuramate--L-alanine ligase [Robiginitalea aestuariiviva]